MIRLLVYLSLFGAIACAQDTPASLDCKNPPASAALQEVLPCIVGKGIDLKDAKGTKFTGRLSVRGNGTCDEGSTCALQLRRLLRTQNVLASDVRSVKYRPPASSARKALGWAVAAGIIVGLATAEIQIDKEVSVLTVGLGPVFAIPAGMTVARAPNVTVDISASGSREATNAKQGGS